LFLSLLTAIELLWWAFAWSAGAAPWPYLHVSVALSVMGLVVSLALRRLLSTPGPRPSWSSLGAATGLIGLGASLFLPLKYAIPSEIPFWLDLPLAGIEQSLFGADPWQVLDRILGPALVPVDRVYALWLPIQTLGLFLVVLQPPSPAKSRALIAYGLAWLVLGVAAAVLFSSVGPIFYDRVFGGTRFALLARTLNDGGASAMLAESGAMWRSYATGEPGFVAGMSAFPSMHVAISVWLFLTARTLAHKAAPFAAAYFLFVWIASVQLGWHYVADGLGGAVGMLALWLVAAPVDRALARRMTLGPIETSFAVSR
jgi:hypothetical protein